VRQATATFSRRRPGSAPTVEGAPFKQGDLVAGRYEIREMLGMGPVGFVYRARDAQVDVDLALKVINPRLVQTSEERKVFQKTLRLARKLSHPNLVRVYEDGEDQDRPFFTMQLAEGMTLRKLIDLRISKGQFFPLKDVEPILVQVCAALDSAHKVGPHTDLRPENVVVFPDLLKVKDFGLGLAIPRLPFVQALKSRKGDAYLSPEYVSGGEIDHRTDVYAVGVILGEMLAGVTPEDGIPELREKNPELPASLEGLYRKALNQNPLARPRSAGALYEEFAELSRKASPPPLRKRDSLGETPTPALRPRPVPPADEEGPVTQESRVRPGAPVIPAHELDPDRQDTEAEILSLPNRMGAASGPPPLPREEETAVLEPLPEPEPTPPPPSRRIPGARELRPSSSRARSSNAVWLVLLTLSGLVVGGAGGWWVLKGMKRKSPVTMDAGVPVPVAVVPPPVVEPLRVVEAPVEQAAPDAGTPRALTKAEKAKLEAEQRKADALAKKEEERLAAEERKRLEAEGRRAADERRVAEAETKRAESEAKKAEEARKLAEAKKAEEARKAEEAKKAEAARLQGETKPAAATAGVAPGTCPAGMRLIPAGPFTLGTPASDDMKTLDDRGAERVDLKAFCVDQYEYPNQFGVKPVSNVPWSSAKKLCEGKGKRLCEESEWEKACKGQGNVRFPYGNSFQLDACNTEDDVGDPRPLANSGAFSRCRSGYGVADMSGNLAEWTNTPFKDTPQKVIKGGSFGRPDVRARCSARFHLSPGAAAADTGFRCCADLK
jgi:serine/threonine protein kinase/formylglycine-generating enzyme required for sulfatase activity